MVYIKKFYVYGLFFIFFTALYQPDNDKKVF